MDAQDLIAQVEQQIRSVLISSKLSPQQQSFFMAAFFHGLELNDR